MQKNILNKLRIPLNPAGSSARLLILCIIIIASAIRIWAYGNPKLSIAGNDTLSYVESSQVPLFSSEMMMGRRMLSTNLLYKILEPKEGYQILVNGSIHTTRRVFQPGFDRIAIFQLSMSLLGWGFLALTVSENLKTTLMKISGAITILLFAFTPQMADWDSILMSESLTFSLFALQLALLLPMVFSIFRDPSSKNLPQFIFWAFIYFWWTFLRDTNLFTSLVTIGLTATLLIFPKYRKSKVLAGGLGFLAVIFILGLYTTANSTRSLVQIINVYNDDLLHSPARIATLKELGMPDPGTPDYQPWFNEKSAVTLLKFMFIHPGYPATKIIKDFPGTFTEIKQTYFNVREHPQMRGFLFAIGDALHPENTTPFLLNLLLLFGLILTAVKNVHGTSRPWAWLAVWLFLTASLTLIPTILGDTWALNRHALFSTMLYRLCMWLFAIIIMDMAIEQNTAQPVLAKNQ